MGQKLKSALRQLQKFADRPWYFPLLGLLAAADLFILVVPTDALLVSSVMLQPKKWVRAFFWVGLGSALGALALGASIQSDLAAHLQASSTYPIESSTWIWLKEFFAAYGAIALAVIAVSPLVQFPVVAMAAASGMPLLELFLISLAGRWIKSAVFAYFASHAPKVVLGLPFLRKELEIVEIPTKVESLPR
jgi:membrane protein YqaA with SNARE-associated domain